MSELLFDASLIPEQPEHPGAVLVVGATVLDRIFYVERLPRPGETAIGHRMELHAGGKGANQALAASRMGARVLFISAVGRDEAGDLALAPLAEAAVETTGVVRVEGHPTAEAVIPVDAHGENQITACPGAYHHLEPEHLEQHASLFQQAGWMLVQNELRAETVAHAIALAHEYKLKVVFNPDPYTRQSPRPPRGLHVLVPNAQQAADILGVEDYLAVPPTQRRDRWSGVGARHVVVTLGHRGGEWITPEGRRYEFSPVAVNAVDSVGAGDAFSGVLTAMLAEGLPFATAVGAANHAAGLSVRSRGAQTGLPDRAELLESLASDRQERA
ncbi:MAG: Bifunctional ribokinase/ribose-5-phosphate isomerase A [Calditrichaeota bacterium]|nr:Bifunctional ribokinase/ribose-5-phosphate isomerase A [Calditrichota bacterium]